MRKQSLIASPFVAIHLMQAFRFSENLLVSIACNASINTAVAVNTSSTAVAVLAAARSRFGSDSPPDCHSLPKRRDERNSKNFFGESFC